MLTYEGGRRNNDTCVMIDKHRQASRSTTVQCTCYMEVDRDSDAYLMTDNHKHLS